MASQVRFEVVILSDNADFSGLDDDGVDDRSEPGLAAFDSAERQALGEGLAEGIHGMGIKRRVLDQIRLGALKRGLRDIALLSKLSEAFLKRWLGHVEDAALDAAI